MNNDPKIENPSAFPRNTMRQGGSPEGSFQEEIFGSDGMTLRDYFAAKAMAGMAASDHWDANFDSKPGYLEQVARVAYLAADAMLAQRQKP